MFLYPRLPHPVAERLASERGRLAIDAAVGLALAEHPDMYYAATGGQRVDSRRLITLRDKLVSLASANQYPTSGTEASKAEFDREASIVLHTTMGVSANEAAQAGVWEFMAAVLLCDLVRWRFPGGENGTPVERFLSGRRNTFQRLWWRGFALADPGSEDPYHLVRTLGEDELVQIMERPFLAGNATLARAVARQLLAAASRHEGVSRRYLIRECQKHLRRLASFTSFDALGGDMLDVMVEEVFNHVAKVAESPRVAVAGV